MIIEAREIRENQSCRSNSTNAVGAKQLNHMESVSNYAFYEQNYFIAPPIAPVVNLSKLFKKFI